MSGFPNSYAHNAPPPSSTQADGAPPSSSSKADGAPPSSATLYGAAAPYSANNCIAPTAPPLSDPYGSSYGAQVPSTIPPAGTPFGTMACFQMADQDGNGFIDDKELQRALSSCNQSFSLRTVQILMYSFTNSSARKIGPQEFASLFYSLMNWKIDFEAFDRDKSGRIDASELREALDYQGLRVSPLVLDAAVSGHDKSGVKNQTIGYDKFIECCITLKLLTEKFNEKETAGSGLVTFTYESFMLAILPILIA